VAVAYKLDGEELSSYPADLDVLERAEVIYKEFPGWQESTTNCRTWSELPQRAKDYVEVRYFICLGKGNTDIETF
jgi:adenylosuccinate synthase